MVAINGGHHNGGGTMRKLRLTGLIAVAVLAGAIAASADDQPSLDTQVKDAIQLFKKTDSTIQKTFDTAYGYVVFPSIGKGAIGIGGAAGDGQVYEKGSLVGTARMTQITIGAQLGGQKFAEVIFFEDKTSFENFKGSEWAMSAGVSAVAAAESASADAKYKQGVIVFTVAKGGLMFEASVGGQKFRYTPFDKK
jgi:lipid-binding SYLF domain-containing protein